MKTIRSYPELIFTVAFAALTVAISHILRLPIVLPNFNSAAFVGMHYLYPLLGLAAWTVIVLIGQKKARARTLLIALPCYAIVLLCHFNIKLWAPHINPILWDDVYWRVDTVLYPLVKICLEIRRALDPVVPLTFPAYLFSFIAIFYVSFCYHAIRTPMHFRKLVLGAILIQGLGALSYLIAPAIGPFLLQEGVTPHASAAQAALLSAYHANVEYGASWLEREGAAHFTFGLAAMPSLHVGCTFLFLLYARRYAPVLAPLYYVLFCFIAVTAVASRWHYLIDLPAGIALAWCCYRIAHFLLPDPVDAHEPELGKPWAGLGRGLLSRAPNREGAAV